MRYIIPFSVIFLFVYFYNHAVDYFFEKTGIPSLNYGKYIDEVDFLIADIENYFRQNNITFEYVSRDQTYPWVYLNCQTTEILHLSESKIEDLKKIVPKDFPRTRIYLFLYNNKKKYFVLRLK